MPKYRLEDYGFGWSLIVRYEYRPCNRKRYVQSLIPAYCQRQDFINAFLPTPTPVPNPVNMSNVWDDTDIRGRFRIVRDLADDASSEELPDQLDFCPLDEQDEVAVPSPPPSRKRKRPGISLDRLQCSDSYTRLTLRPKRNKRRDA